MKWGVIVGWLPIFSPIDWSDIMNIIFYENVNADDRVVDKTAALEAATKYEVQNGVLREEVDILDPSFNTTDNVPLGCNYAYIPDFRRWYYVTIEVIRTGIRRVTMHVDVLMTWKDAIKASEGVVTRTYGQGENGNLNAFIVDDEMPMFSYTEDTIDIRKAFTNKWTAGAFVCTVG